MAYSQSDIDELKKAIAMGALSVRFADRQVTYRSLSEMRETLRLMEGEVSGKRRIRQVRLYARKGL